MNIVTKMLYKKYYQKKPSVSKAKSGSSEEKLPRWIHNSFTKVDLDSGIIPIAENYSCRFVKFVHLK